MNTALLWLGCVLLGLTATLAAPIGQNQPTRGRGRRPKTKDDVKNYLNQFGHWRSRKSQSKGNGTDDDMRNSLRAFQKFFGLKVTGEANNETLDLMAAPRCGRSDDNTADGRRKRYALIGPKWPTTALTYNFVNYTADLPVSVTRSELQRAFKYWSDVTPLTFTESNSPSSQIKMSFVRLDHGDGGPFDGPGHILAHAFPPTDGTIHFDDDESWTNSNNGANIGQVGTHELGHALGLAHSTVNSSVMYSYYTYTTNFALTPDDIQGIQAIYGKPRAASNSTSSTARSSASSSSTRRPSTSTSSTRRPSTSTSSTKRSSRPTSTSSTRRPSTSTSSTKRPSTSTSSTKRPSTSTSTTKRSSTSTSSRRRPPTSTSFTRRASTSTSSTRRPSTSTSTTKRSSTSTSSTRRSSTSTSSTRRPSTSSTTRLPQTQRKLCLLPNYRIGWC